MPNRYQKNQLNMNMIKNILGLSKVFHKLLNSFRVISSVIIDKFAILLHEKREKLIDMSRVCITKRPRALDGFLNKVK